VQLCMVHMVRNSLRHVSHKHMQAVATDLKAIYSSATEEEAELNLELKALEMGWARSQYQQVLARAVGAGDPAICLPR
jgi:transposase-like protein